ncbi:very-short-patch-repair endonuclease [Nocardioides zeae]|uniref:Very-short-patch-repair endonuclease n=1 Tax=Nocardioides zeae TaxID=1457234 RepID=A0ACC6IK92_9ACTN|nr:hypothetical protein [Nocardioides zeae]MDR6211032.1 very-short-patch-repair endonuclease [Nocardioides zeae]
MPTDADLPVTLPPDLRVGRLRRAGWERVTRGVHRRSDAEEAELLDLRGCQEALPDDAVLTGLTAAFARGWWLPMLPEDVPVFATTRVGSGQSRRPEVRLIRAAEAPTVDRVGDLRLASPVRTLLDCGRLLGPLDLAVVLGGALRPPGDAPAVTVAEVEAAAARAGARGASRLREALALLVDPGRAESAPEVTLGALCRTLRVPVVAQHEVRTAAGSFVARGDLWVVGTRTLVEYDGAVHREKEAYADGLRRDRRLRSEDWGRIAVTRDDLVERSQQLARELYEAAGLAHDQRRVLAWWRLLRTSGETPAGRAWLSGRWARRTNARRADAQEGEREDPRDGPADGAADGQTSDGRHAA